MESTNGRVSISECAESSGVPHRSVDLLVDQSDRSDLPSLRKFKRFLQFGNDVVRVLMKLTDSA